MSSGLRRRALAVLLLAALVLLIPAGQPWVVERSVDTGVETARSGAEVAPWLAPVTLLALASALAVVGGGPLTRRAGRLLLLASGVGLMLAVPLSRPAGGLTLWWYAAAVAALLLGLAATLTAVSPAPRGAPGPGAGVDRGTQGGRAVPREQQDRRRTEQAWKTLDQGDDPTGGPAD